MPLDLRHHDWSRRTEPDDMPEWMDEPCSREDLRACLSDLEAVNRLTFGYRPTLLFSERAATRHPLRPLRILDVGFGGGGLLQQVARWAQRKRLTVELTGIDLNPESARLAKERYGSAHIQWLAGNAFDYAGEVDVVLSSLLTHHLSTSDVVQFLRWMESKAAVGWFINDLERSSRSAVLFRLLATGMRWHRFVRHDGPVSFARSFTPADWRRMLAEAGVPLGSVAIEHAFPSRLCVRRLR